MVIDAAGEPARRFDPGMTPIFWTRQRAERDREHLDGLCRRIGLPGAPHRVVPVRIEEIES